MMHWQCPNCGHQNKRYTMSTDPNAPGALDILRGKAGTTMRWWLTAAVFILLTLNLAAARIIL